jgi:hypothetical protein
VNVSFLCGGRNRCPEQPPNQPNDQRKEEAEDDKGYQENQKDPARASHRCDIAANGRCGIAANSPAEHGDIPANLHFLIESKVAAKDSRVAADLSLILNHDAAAERSGVARNMPTHSDAAAKTGCLADFFTGADADVVSDLSTLATSIREGYSREYNANK